MKKYTKEHEWIELINENEAYVGITDFASHELGDIVFVDIEKGLNSIVDADSSFGIVEAVKTVSDLFMPLSCEILEVNQSVLDTPNLLNDDSNTNWILKVRILEPSLLDSLLSENDYNTLIGK
jgi:glycine cleavage system H protein